MSLAAGLALSLAAALIPVGCLIALLISIVRWTQHVEPPPGGGDGPGGMGTRPRAPRPHGGPSRRCSRRATLYRSRRPTRTR